jgi:hypothetical protein
VVLSDRSETIDLLNKNIALNGLESKVIASELLWGAARLLSVGRFDSGKVGYSQYRS